MVVAEAEPVEEASVEAPATPAHAATLAATAAEKDAAKAAKLAFGEEIARLRAAVLGALGKQKPEIAAGVEAAFTASLARFDTLAPAVAANTTPDPSGTPNRRG